MANDTPTPETSAGMTPIPAATTSNDAAQNDLGANTPQTTAPQAAPAVGAAPAAPTAPTKPGLIGSVEQGGKHVLSEIFQTLAGGKKKEWTQTENGPVATYRDLKPGEMARGILAAAITGLAGGYDPANRGKGPAMSSAFSAGFKAEDASRKDQDEKAEKEAQDQFKNKTIADEALMKKHADARAQQESAVRMQRDVAETESIKQAASQGTIKFSQEQLDYKNAQLDKFESAKTSGYAEVQEPNGKVHLFASTQDAEEAVKKYTNDLIRPGDYDTRIMYDPNRSGYVVMRKPKGYDDLQVMRFAKKNANNSVAKDSEGNPIPDGTKDASGKVMDPILMTGKVYSGWLDDQAKNKKSAAETKQAEAAAAMDWAHAKKFLADAAKEDALSGAHERMFAAGNQPWAVNTDTGLPYMTEKDRGFIGNFAHTQAAIAQDTINKGNNQLVLAAGTPQEATIRQSIVEAQSALDTSTSTLRSLGTPVSREAAFANAFVQRYTTDGKFDGKQAIETFDKKVKDGTYKTSWKPEELARVREQLQARIVTASTTQAAAKATEVKATDTPDEAAAKVQLEKATARAKEEKAAKLEQLKRITNPTYSGAKVGTVPNPELREDIADEIKNHPKWTDDEKIEFMDKMLNNAPQPGPTTQSKPEMVEMLEVATGIHQPLTQAQIDNFTRQGIKLVKYQK